ncbi:MAG: hypothetical protein QM780_00795 [Hyphomicrobium sp.]|uniref:hypothetical protein n=1 Tax=Hyphomicrobium sp. TaxID=82 RepID=UPI0039E5DD01
MKFGAILFWAIAMTAGVLFAGAAWAGDAGPATGGQTSSKLDQQINQAVGSNGASEDVDARIKDLDATRAAIDEKKPATISLGVSGWVTQQVQYNIKQ